LLEAVSAAMESFRNEMVTSSRRLFEIAVNPQHGRLVSDI
jgi:PIN domain nuclease of toxin-antitoxin system